MIGGPVKRSAKTNGEPTKGRVNRVLRTALGARLVAGVVQQVHAPCGGAQGHHLVGDGQAGGGGAHQQRGHVRGQALVPEARLPQVAALLALACGARVRVRVRVLRF